MRVPPVSNHESQGRIRLEDREKTGSGFSLVALDEPYWRAGVAHYMSEADAKRFVAMSNACVGITTTALEASVISKTIAAIKRVMKLHTVGSEIWTMLDYCLTNLQGRTPPESLPKAEPSEQLGVGQIIQMQLLEDVCAIHGWQHKELAGYLGITPRQVSNYFTGKTPIPRTVVIACYLLKNHPELANFFQPSVSEAQDDVIHAGTTTAAKTKRGTKKA